MSATDTCTALLPGLDPDILEYIVGILDDVVPEDADDVAERIDTIAGFLESAEFCDNGTDAKAKAKELIAHLKGGGTNGSADNNNNDNNTKKDDEYDDEGYDYAYQMEMPKVQTTIAGKVPVSISVVSSGKEDDEEGDNDEDEEGAVMEKIQTLKETNNITKKTAAKEARLAKKKQAKGGRGKKNSKLTASELATQQAVEIEEELAAARIAAVQARRTLGAYKGALDATAFTLPNPGGGAPLLEDAACTLVWGRRYGLIGRNGMGKSTLLRAFAARRVGDIPANVTVHYVSQEVNLTDAQRIKTPVEIVVDADIERTLLLQEVIELEQKIATESLDAKGSHRHGEVLARLEEIGSDSAHRRATTLLENLGFTEELRARPLAQLSGGWRVRTMLAAAIFAKPDMLLLDEPTNHLSILGKPILWDGGEISKTWSFEE
jgi:ATP-binding cassette, subfamily F, member 3